MILRPEMTLSIVFYQRTNIIFHKKEFKLRKNENFFPEEISHDL